MPTGPKMSLMVAASRVVARADRAVAGYIEHLGGPERYELRVAHMMAAGNFSHHHAA